MPLDLYLGNRVCDRLLPRQRKRDLGVVSNSVITTRQMTLSGHLLTTRRRWIPYFRVESIGRTASRLAKKRATTA